MQSAEGGIKKPVVGYTEIYDWIQHMEVGR